MVSTFSKLGGARHRVIISSSDEKVCSSVYHGAHVHVTEQHVVYHIALLTGLASLRVVNIPNHSATLRVLVPIRCTRSFAGRLVSEPGCNP